MSRSRPGRGRWDHQAIYEAIPPGSSVLDLGCGDGELLARLVREKGVQGQGVEKDLAHVLECTARGVAVYHADLDEGLAGFPDAFFDYVILEQTLQTVRKPLSVLEEMLRVGRAGIVSFPNFGHVGVVASLAQSGRMPVTPELPYHWHETPNIHLLTLDDFLDWVRARGAVVERGLCWMGGEVRRLEEVDGRLAREVLFVLTGGGRVGVARSPCGC